jgi:hypothetical protein
MAHSPRKNNYGEQLWNVSLLPMPALAARRASELPQGPGPQGGGSALRSAALLSVATSEFENATVTAQAA